jgi:sigma-B regulation protein RsbU (phosphoserine phosphatase)
MVNYTPQQIFNDINNLSNEEFNDIVLKLSPSFLGKNEYIVLVSSKNSVLTLVSQGDGFRKTVDTYAKSNKKNGLNNLISSVKNHPKYESSLNKYLVTLIINDNSKIKQDSIDYLLKLLSIYASFYFTQQHTIELHNTIKNKTFQLNQLYELSSEFSGILDVDILTKLLIFTIQSDFLIEKFLLTNFEGDSLNVLEHSIKDENSLSKIMQLVPQNINEPAFTSGKYHGLYDEGIRIIIPMKIKQATKGLLFLGDKKNKESYSNFDIEFIRSVANLGIISIENRIMFQEILDKQKIERDLETAREIQKNLLPKRIIQPDNFEISAHSKSAKMVGGDFFDIIIKNKSSLYIAIGDVSGKGISASLLVANTIAYLRSICRQNLSITESTDQLNTLVYENTLTDIFITFFWGLLETKKMEFTFVNAGHNAALLIRDKEIIKLEKGGMLLGVIETAVPYESETVKLQEGDYIIFFTDGVTEAMNIKDEEFSDERFENICKTFTNESADEVKEKLLKEIDNFTGSIEQSDDITLLVIRIK